MSSFFSRLSSPWLAAPQPSAVDVWHRAAEADYRLTRLLADHFDARLGRSGRSQRVGWRRDSRSACGILLPDPLPSLHPADDDWYLYYVWGETLFRRTRGEREKLRMLVLPDSVEDWADLLRQAVRRDVFDVRGEVAPQYVTALGEIEAASSGYEFTLSSCAPPTAAACAFRVAGLGETPEAAARNACGRWLRTEGHDVTA